MFYGITVDDTIILIVKPGQYLHRAEMNEVKEKSLCHRVGKKATQYYSEANYIMYIWIISTQIRFYLKFLFLFQVELTANSSEITKYGLKRLWGVPDTSAYVGHLFRMEIPKEAFSGKVLSYKVTIKCLTMFIQGSIVEYN